MIKITVMIMIRCDLETRRSAVGGDQDTVPAGIPYAPPPLFHASPDHRHRPHHHIISILLYLLLHICFII